MEFGSAICKASTQTLPNGSSPSNFSDSTFAAFNSPSEELWAFPWVWWGRPGQESVKGAKCCSQGHVQLSLPDKVGDSQLSGTMAAPQASPSHQSQNYCCRGGCLQGGAGDPPEHVCAGCWLPLDMGQLPCMPSRAIEPVQLSGLGQ